MVTLKDVAREAGLTVTTVSRVLNNRGYISENAKEAVYAAMDKLNYRPNEVARSLSLQSTNTIGVIVPHIRHPYFAELISNIENYAAKHKYKILLCNSKETDEKEREYYQMCVSNRVAGIILCSGSVEIKEFHGGNFPIVTIERNLDNGTAAIECDNHEGGRIAAGHLIEQGCTRLLHFSGIYTKEMPADARTLGFKEMCEEQGIFYKEISTNEQQYEYMDYRNAIEEALRADESIDGIFASGDVIAAQILQVCAKLGRKVPEEIKVIGFDDVVVAGLTTPPLTTVHQPIKEMSKAAVDAIIDVNKGKRVEKRTILPIRLVKRETT